MYNPFKKNETPSVIDPVIENLISQMSGFDPSDKEYSAMAMNLETLMKAKATEPKPDQISKDTIALVVANLVGIGMILAFEKNGIVTSRAFSLVTRTR